MKNNGVPSEKEFEDRLNSAYGKMVFIERLPDTKSIKGAIKNGFIQGRPSDYIVTIRGAMHYAEVKSCSDKVSFPFANFQREQWRAMIRQVAAGGNYCVYLHNLTENKWYLLEGREIIAAEKAGKKSIKWSEMEEWII